MIDFTEIPYDGDTWELFARDFLQERGLFIESPPDRGPDGGKDILATEELQGTLNKYKFRWLVSCKHFATRGVSVSEKDEPNILERLAAYRADGFIGFYSTLPSSGLNTRLQSLRKENKIKDYQIFDHRLIENHLITASYSSLMLRYFPESYKIIRPLHSITGKYEPLLCEECGKDLLLDLFEGQYKANLVYVQRYDLDTAITYIDDVYCVCKIDCDKKSEQKILARGLITRWKDISDLVIPIEYLRYVLATMNRLRSGKEIYSDEAFSKEKIIFMKLAQKVLRHTTEQERDRFCMLLSLPF